MTRPEPPCHVGDHVQAFHPHPTVQRVTGQVERCYFDAWIKTHRVFIQVDGRTHNDGSPVVETLFLTEHLKRVLDCPHPRAARQTELFELTAGGGGS